MLRAMTPMANAGEAADALRALAPGLGARGLERLAHMYSATRLQGTEGEAEPGNTRISMLQGSVLHRLVRESAAQRTLEVGFAYGFSTVWLLDALPPQGAHVAIDPHERRHYAGVGLHQVALLQASAAFEWREALSVHALTDAMRREERYDLIFIDGNHRFDDVVVDFYLADPLLRVGGLLAFDDLWMPSVRSAVSFVTANRAYRVVEQPEANMAVLRKTAEDARDWRHYVPFPIYTR